MRTDDSPVLACHRSEAKAEDFQGTCHGASKTFLLYTPLLDTVAMSMMRRRWCCVPRQGGPCTVAVFLFP